MNLALEPWTVLCAENGKMHFLESYIFSFPSFLLLHKIGTVPLKEDHRGSGHPQEGRR